MTTTKEKNTMSPKTAAALRVMIRVNWADRHNPDSCSRDRCKLALAALRSNGHR
jgi:hypothetical protein